MTEEPHGHTALITSIDFDLDDEWMRALPTSLTAATTKRKSEWISGRIAAQRAFAKAGVEVRPAHFSDGDFRRLTSRPQWRFSISHTSDWAFAWVTPEGDRFSIGVDVEDVERRVSARVEERFRHADDRIDLAPIAIWSLKEAAFKAIAPDAQKDLTVSKIILESSTFRCADREVTGSWRQEVAGGLVRSFAWVDLAHL